MCKRNPNGYGCVTRLSGNRTRPWIIKVTVSDEAGNTHQIPVGYAETRESALIMLAQYNNNPWNIDRDKVTLAILFQQWANIKLPKLSKSSRGALKSAFKHCSKYYGVKYRLIKAYQMQESIDNCGCGYATQGAIKALWGHLDKFAFECDIIDKMYSQLTTAAPVPDTKRTPFTEKQLEDLWHFVSEPWVDTVLIFLYTGFRLNELLTMKTGQIDMEQKIFIGGFKTRSGKDRIVPIHPRIQPLVRKWVDKDEEYFFTYQSRKISTTVYYELWKSVMTLINADKTPHEARHTMETMLDNAGANRKCIDMIMGHKSKDVGNRVYNHKTLEQLRETIALLK